MKKSLLLIGLAALFLITLLGFSWIADLYMPRNIKKAYDKKTRSYDGKVSANYWQNSANYNIEVAIDPTTRLISGSEKITYFNDSPDNLKEIAFQLFPNMYKKGNRRDFEVAERDESEGVIITALKVNGKVVDRQKALRYYHTMMALTLEKPLLSGEKMEFELSWHYTLNETSHNRTGVVDASSFFVAYFFPRIAVYDDVDGWTDFMYTGDTEFYNDFGNYEVAITIPKDYIVWATGILENPEEILTKKYLERYQKAFTSDDIIHIINATECTKGEVTQPKPTHTWTFKAENVSDFAFASSDHYLWDATSLVVDEATDRRVLIDAGYDKSSVDFYQVTAIAREATKFMSYQIPGVPFPYPQVTIFNGLDAMEYPMLVNNISEKDIKRTAKVTAHEILHSYLPFYLGINETKYAWMDEGFTSFCDYLFLCDYLSPEEAGIYYLGSYKQQAGDALDAPIFTLSEYLKRPVYSYNSYPKPAGFFLTLKDLLGEEQFKITIKAFMTRWNGKHPTPYDFFFTLNNTTGQDLDWLIRPWFYEFGYVDLAIGNVSKTGDTYRFSIKKEGNYPAPVHVKLTFADGKQQVIKKTAEVWQKGNTDFQMEINTAEIIQTIELLDPSLLDVDLMNNVGAVE